MVTSASTFIIDEVLAVFHGAQADLGADRRHAGGVDDDVDEVALDHQASVAGDGDLAGFHGFGERAGIAGLRPNGPFPGRRCRPPWPRWAG